MSQQSLHPCGADVARALMCGVATFDDLVAVITEGSELLAAACFGNAQERSQAQQVLEHMIEEAGPSGQAKIEV